LGKFKNLAEKVMKNKSLDGFKYYKEAANQGYLASKWWVGWCKFCGYGTDKNEIEGEKKMESVALSRDNYWINVQVNIFASN
jgi:hypothetical protein